jgi:hypothetical protein
MLSLALWASAAIAFINIALSAVLLIVYIRNYKSLKSYFTAGLVVFSLLFLALNLAIVGLWLFLYTNISVAELIIDQAMLFMVLINLAELVGLATLVRITLK